MSSDNYYYVVKVPGGFAALMGFASDDYLPTYQPGRDTVFNTADDAMSYAEGSYAEYGAETSDEVEEALRIERVEKEAQSERFREIAKGVAERNAELLRRLAK